MSYHHKRKSCFKKTRNIIEGLLEEGAEYRTVEVAPLPATTKPAEKKLSNGSTNILPGNTEPVEVDFEENLEYEPTDKIDCEAATVKDSMEKKGKRKRRNYLEFRPDYDKD